MLASGRHRRCKASACRNNGIAFNKVNDMFRVGSDALTNARDSNPQMAFGKHLATKLQTASNSSPS